MPFKYSYSSLSLWWVISSGDGAGSYYNSGSAWCMQAAPGLKYIHWIIFRALTTLFLSSLHDQILFTLKTWSLEGRRWGLQASGAVTSLALSSQHESDIIVELLLSIAIFLKMGQWVTFTFQKILMLATKPDIRQ